MVMIAIAVFSTLAAALVFSMKVETKLARSADDEQQLLWLGRSGVELARWVLAQHPPSEPFDALNQVWAGGPGGPGESNSVLSSVDLGKYPVGDGTVAVKIVDLERRANINTAPAPELQQALTVMGVGADSLSVVVDSIQDWRGPVGPPRIAGAQSDYYQGLNPPYNAKNAPFDNLAELLLVKGVTPEMYWGTGASEHAPGTFQHPKLGFGNDPGQAPEYLFGLVDVFTPISSGKININTAGTYVLQMIPGLDPQTSENIVRQRSGPDGADGTDDDTPFRGVGQLATAGLNPRALQEATPYCTVSSSAFEVKITAKIGDSTRDFTAILFRNGTDIQVVSFWWK